MGSPIRAFKWQKVFEGVFKLKVDIVNLFYKGFINDKENYVVVKHEKVYFGPEEISTFYKLDGNTIGQVIFKNPMHEDMRDALKTIARSGTQWDITLTQKLQFFYRTSTQMPLLGYSL